MGLGISSTWPRSRAWRMELLEGGGGNNGTMAAEPAVDLPVPSWSGLVVSRARMTIWMRSSSSLLSDESSWNEEAFRFCVRAVNFFEGVGWGGAMPLMGASRRP